MLATAKSNDLRSSDNGARHFAKYAGALRLFALLKGLLSATYRTNRTVGCRPCPCTPFIKGWPTARSGVSRSAYD